MQYLVLYLEEKKRELLINSARNLPGLNRGTKRGIYHSK